jgi:uncharacterized protein DUF1684
MRTALLMTALLAPSFLSAQTVPPELARDRADRARWLIEDHLSPARAAALVAVGPTGVSLGPTGADIPVAEAPHGAVEVRGGGLVLTGWGPDRILAPGRATSQYGIRLVPLGTPARPMLAVYRDDKPGKRPTYFGHLSAARQVVTLTSTTPKSARTLAPDGTTVEATEIGTVLARIGADTVTLRVMRFPVSEEESQLLINFRDATNGAGSYPAGRFVELIPIGGDRYTLDLNRAFNPYCAYSSVFPCPIPWAGNVFEVRVEAGEKYPAEAVGR